ncbi:MAG: class I SAM-dependent DNA methyltransferase [Thermoanaerobaculia bacterium]|nr:class I SAM-dependent DNA methyltransferase [Thermoanaerobaculia bacterium]
MTADPIAAFVDRWAASGASERANKDLFLAELCDALGVPRPDPATGDSDRDLYVFERDSVLQIEGGKVSIGHIDLYKDGCFVLEAKQGSAAEARKKGTARRDTPGWTVAMQAAFGQALSYARTLTNPPPFLLVADIGYCFDLYASFDGSTNYRPFPRPQGSRLFFKDLPAHLETLRRIWTEPLGLDPTRNAARVTRQIAAHLAELARSLEPNGHAPQRTASFLMRLLFTMFAEDAGLLPKHLFTKLLEERWVPDPSAFVPEVENLWQTMRTGGHVVGIGRIRKFNGGFFSEHEALPLNQEQLRLLLEAGKASWTEVEPAIFGTLLERALDPKERHALGAHFTPRAYVERLVRPTIEEPLREEWDLVRAQVHALVSEGKVAEAQKALKAFHERLCRVRVLDPACGTGNFLYVALDLLKRMESEVLGLLQDLGEAQGLLDLHGVTVSPAQLLGIEINPRAREIAELVLWIGFLRWQYGNLGKGATIPEPVLHDYGNIECRDAVLAWDRIEPALDADGKPLTRWDGETTMPSPVTGEPIPDETARASVWKYVNPRKAEWPEAEFVVGNPPFVGNKRMRAALGDGYVEALRKAHGDVPDSADLVMYWWNHAATLLRANRLTRFGLITTNSITQAFNRRVVANHISAEDGLSVVFAVPDHPWVDATDGAAVRIAMTVSAKGRLVGRVLRLVSETAGPGGEAIIHFSAETGQLAADLSSGATVLSANVLRANQSISFMGVILVGQGFVVDAEDPLWDGGAEALRPYLVGMELNRLRKDRRVIDFYGLTTDEARRRYPAAYQRVLERVKPERDASRDETFRKAWWIHGRPRPEMREALTGLDRFVAVCRTAKHLVFQFVPADVLVESKIVAIALETGDALGTLSSRVHFAWASAAGSRHGVGNDFTYNNSTCFLTFPFPVPTPVQTARIGDLGEGLDAHRKRRQALHPGLTITGMYNVVEKLRSGEPLTAKEKAIHEQGLVSVLRQIHDDLDAAVFEAYGWPATLTDEEILERLVALNAERAEEEKRGLIRWLRPEFQNPAGKRAEVQGEIEVDEEEDGPVETPAAAKSLSWPKALPDRISAVRQWTAGQRKPIAAADAAATFKGAKPADVEPILESLGALGLLRAVPGAEGRRWASSVG